MSARAVISFICSIILQLLIAYLECDPDFKRFGDVCYIFLQEQNVKTRIEDQDVCSNIDADMVTVNTKEIEDFIAENTDLPYFVTGGRKMVSHLVLLFFCKKVSYINLINCISSLTFNRKMEIGNG